MSRRSKKSYLDELGKNTKKVNSKRKGGTFENDIAKKLNNRFNTKEFCKTPGSGAFATTHSLPKHIKVYGDLIAPENFRFIIECKKGYDGLRIADLFNHGCDLWKWLRKLEKEEKFSGSSPLIVWKQDYKETLIIINQDTFLDVLILNPKIENIKFNNYVIVSFRDFLDLEDDFFFN